MTIAIKPTASGSTIEQNGSTILTVDSSGNIAIANDLTVTGTPPTPDALSTASGSAPSYSARAWVNFNGTGTVAIRDSGNVSSITDNGTGDYTVNFTTALADVNYAANVIAQRLNDRNTRGNVGFQATYSGNKTTSILRVASTDSGFTLVDSDMIDVAVFR